MFVGTRASLLLVSCLFLTACAGAPDGYPPPLQRQVPAGAAEDLIGRFVNMNDANADSYIVRDVQDTVEGTGWRWAHDRPELRFILSGTAGQKFTIDFSFPEQNFKETGPVTVSFLINGKPLDKVRYTTPGDKHFEKAVPESWLRPGPFTSFSAIVNPPWIAPSDKARLGFVLYRAGFID